MIFRPRSTWVGRGTDNTSLEKRLKILRGRGLPLFSHSFWLPVQAVREKVKLNHVPKWTPHLHQCGTHSLTLNRRSSKDLLSLVRG